MSRPCDQNFNAALVLDRFQRLLTSLGESLPPITVVQVPPTELGPTVASGVSPRPEFADERFRVDRHGEGATVCAATEAGAFRGLVRLLVDPELTGSDGPRFAWRGLSVDLVRHPWPLETVVALTDLAALHGLNVLHLHLTDHQGWRLPFPPGTASEHSFSEADLAAIREHAAERFITVVPEIDLPGHVAAALQAHPDLVDRENPPAHPLVAHLDPDVPGVLDFIREAVTQLVEHFPGSPVHIGGDEAFGMLPAKFDTAVRTAVQAARAAGAPTVVGWQEAVRSGGALDVLQYWMTPADIPTEESMAAAVPPEYADLARAVARSFQDVAGDPGRLSASGVPVLMSPQNPLYFDRRVSDPSVDDRQTEQMQTMGFPGYAPLPTSALLDWDPAAELPEGTPLAGVEAAIWCETIGTVDELAMLVLPRLGLFGERSWRHERLTVADVIAPVRRAASYWTHLGFGEYYRSSDLFGTKSR